MSHNKSCGHRKLFIILALSLLACGLVVFTANYAYIKNKLMLHFLPPKAYMAAIETDYLKDRSGEWNDITHRFTAALDGKQTNGMSLEADVNHLISALTGGSILPEEINLSLAFESDEKASVLLLDSGINGVSCLSVKLLTDHAGKMLYLSVPELTGESIGCSISENALPVRLANYLSNTCKALISSIQQAVLADPYPYLADYLDILESVTLEENYPLTSDSWKDALPVTRMQAVISIDSALEIAAGQIQQIEAQASAAYLLPYFRLLHYTLTYLAEHYPAKLQITAYADRYGQILGHEWALLDEESTLLSMTGLLQDDRTGGKSGELTMLISGALTGGEDFRLKLTVSQLAFDERNGFPTGKINFSSPGQRAFSVQLLFDEHGELPALTASLRYNGFTVVTVSASLQHLPVNTPASYLPGGTVYSPRQWRTFWESMNFTEWCEQVFARTGFRMSDFFIKR